MLLSSTMFAKIVGILTLVCFIYNVDGATDNRPMSECWSGGLECNRYATCRFDTAKSNYTCFCLAGYIGDLCDEDRNECDVGSAPCKKRGVCHNSIGSFRCDCLPGWKGSHCQTADGSGLSTCLTGYTGVNCTDDFDECTQWTENPCEHGSTCINTPGNFTCSCATGFEGKICNEDIDECSLTFGLCHNGGNCTNVPGTYTCVCPYPYTGPACDDISTTVSTTTTTSTTTPTTLLTNSITANPGLSFNITSTTTSTTTPTTPIPTLLTNSITANPGLLSKTPGPVSSTRQNMTTKGPGATSSPNTKNSGATTKTVTPYPTSSNSTSANSSSNSSHQKSGNSDGGGGGGGGGGTNVGVIAGPVVGILAIAGTVAAGLFVYNKYYRNPRKVDPSDETEIGKVKDEAAKGGDTNKNSKWKAPEPNGDQAPVTNGVDTTKP